MSAAGDFFVAGGTLRAGSPSYVTRAADADLLRSALAGEFCYILTSRQMGKSSLMVRTAERLREKGVRTVIIDLTSIGTVTSDEWYLGLLSRLRSGLRLDVDVQTWWQTHANVSVAQRFTLFLRDVVLASVPEPVVIFIDEIDSTLNLNFRDDFFAAIRALYNARASEPLYNRLTFVLLGVATPTDLINDRERTPFNIGRRIELSEFSLADAAPLLAGLQSVFAAQAERILQRIFYWSNGHPYLTQKLCIVATHAGAAPDDAGVDQIVAETFLSEEGRKDTNLTFVQDRIVNSSPTERRQMLQLYRQVYQGKHIADDDRSPIQNRLELYGLLAVRENQLHVRNAIYRHVFNAEWIQAVMPANPQQLLAIYAVIAALLIVVSIASYIYLQPDPDCNTLRQVFQSASTSAGRASALADLSAQGERCRQVVLELFYELDSNAQRQLFRNAASVNQNDLVTLVQNIAVTLEPWPDGHDVEVMEAMRYALVESGLADDDPRVRRIRNWMFARENALKDNHTEAIRYYELALNDDIDDDHPILHFDLALSFIALAQYDSALLQLDEVIRLAWLTPPTPTPTATAATPPTSTQSTPNLQSPKGSQAQVVITLTATHAVTSTRIQSATQTEGAMGTSSIRRVSNFVSADGMIEGVRQTIQDNSELLVFYGQQRDQYEHLALASIPTRAPAFLDVLLEPGVNVRRGPDITYEFIGVTEVGNPYSILGKNLDDSWWQIEFDGQVGWVPADFVRAQNTEGVAISQAPPLPIPNHTLTPLALATPTTAVGVSEIVTAEARLPTLEEATQSQTQVVTAECALAIEIYTEIAQHGICRPLLPGTACYVSDTVEVNTSASIQFDKPGTMVQISELIRIQTSNGGRVILSAQTSAGHVMIIAFDDMSLESGQVITLRRGSNGIVCSKTRSGMLIQIDQGVRGGSLIINGVTLDFD